MHESTGGSYGETVSHLSYSHFHHQNRVPAGQWVATGLVSVQADSRLRPNTHVGMSHATLDSRRRCIYQRLVVDGTRYSTVVDEVSTTFDTPVSTIESDIARLPTWVDDLNPEFRFTPVSRLIELRHNRTRLHLLADDAHQRDDFEAEVAIRREIDQSIVSEHTLWERMGLLRNE